MPRVDCGNRHSSNDQTAGLPIALECSLHALTPATATDRDSCTLTDFHGPCSLDPKTARTALYGIHITHTYIYIYIISYHVCPICAPFVPHLCPCPISQVSSPWINFGNVLETALPRRHHQFASSCILHHLLWWNRPPGAWRNSGWLICLVVSTYPLVN